MKLIIIRGYPGSGKSTLGRRLQSDGYGVFIDHNELLNRIVTMTGDSDGIYDEIVSLELAMVRKLLASGKDVIVGRGFATAAGVAEYLAVAEQVGASHVIVRLDATEELLAKRVQSPTRQNDYTPISTPEQLHDWMVTHPMEDIDAEVCVDIVRPFDQVLEEVTQAV